MKLRVSLLIPSYNAGRWVGQAVESCLAQTWNNCEVIVIDDGSSDDSVERLQAYAGRIQMRCRENRGGNPTRNELLSMASGQWVQFLDADDYLLPGKVEHQLAFLKEHPEADVLYSPQIIEHHAGGQVGEELCDPHDRDGDHDPWAYHLGWKLTQTGGALFRRERLVDVGGWNEAQARCQDNELYFRLLKAGARFVRCPKAESVYRRFEDGTVSTQKGDLLRIEILRLLQEGESFLSVNNELTSRRRQAANQTRFRMARGLWPRDHAAARSIMQIIRASDGTFVPDEGSEAPPIYRALYRWLGFSGAERLAGLRRKLTK